jgi:hypothetical protein
MPSAFMHPSCPAPCEPRVLSSHFSTRRRIAVLGSCARPISSDARRRRLRPGGATSQAPGRRPDLGVQARRCLSPTLWTAPLSIGRVRRAPQIRLTARGALAQPGPLAQEHRPALAAGAVFKNSNKSPGGPADPKNLPSAAGAVFKNSNKSPGDTADPKDHPLTAGAAFKNPIKQTLQPRHRARTHQPVLQRQTTPQE